MRSFSLIARLAQRSRSHRRRAIFRSAPMPRWKARATAIALWLAAGCVPISSYFRMLSSCSLLAAMSGQSDLILSRRTYRNPVPMGAVSHLWSDVP